jgi:Rrf2 family protein
LKLSRKTLFALEAVLDIAYNARTQPVQSKEITQRQGIPRRYLEQVMQQLVKAGILKGVRGPRGGYHLARERRRISVGEIVRVVDALEGSTGEEIYETRSELGRKIVSRLLADLHDAMMTRLDAISIQDLCDQARTDGVRRMSAERPDFTI